MTRNKKIFLYIAYFLLILITLGLFIITRLDFNPVLFTVFISTFTTLFHFTIRFSFANIICNLIKKLIRYDAWWFREKPFEKMLYRILFVKKWKETLPTWNEGDFKVSLNESKIILNNMCFAEAYHEVCMVLSFIPIIFSIWWGEVWVFFWTSLGGAVFDSLFVLIQRFNRPRVLKYYNRTKN